MKGCHHLQGRSVQTHADVSGWSVDACGSAARPVELCCLSSPHTAVHSCSSFQGFCFRPLHHLAESSPFVCPCPLLCSTDPPPSLPPVVHTSPAVASCVDRGFEPLKIPEDAALVISQVPSCVRLPPSEASECSTHVLTGQASIGPGLAYVVPASPIDRTFAASTCRMSSDPLWFDFPLNTYIQAYTGVCVCV